MTQLVPDRQIVDSLMVVHGNKLAIISCLKCECFREDYNKDFKANGFGPKGYILLGDTTCNQLDFQIRHLDAKLLKRISPDLFNVVFFKKFNGELQTKILLTEDSRRIQKEANRFFEL